MNSRRKKISLLPSCQYRGWLALVLFFAAVVVAAGVGGRRPGAAEGPREIENSIGMELMLIPSGEFMMGSSEAEIKAVLKKYPATSPDWFADEKPAHLVRISRPFYLSKYEVTRDQFAEFVSDTGYKTDAEEHPFWVFETEDGQGEEPITWEESGLDQEGEEPVIMVSWNDAEAFAEWLSKKEDRKYRLPTEAEWEYACRAGTRTVYHFGDNPDAGAGWMNGADKTFTSSNRLKTYFSWDDGFWSTAPVGSFRPNAFGLYDLHGNVYEWCADWYGPYAAGEQTNPKGPAEGRARVLRGGSWGSDPRTVRSADRFANEPGIGDQIAGFRLVLVP